MAKKPSRKKITPKRAHSDARTSTRAVTAAAAMLAHLAAVSRQSGNCSVYVRRSDGTNWYVGTLVQLRAVVGSAERQR